MLVYNDRVQKPPKRLVALDLGLVPYTQALQFQRNLAVERIHERLPDLLLFVSHPPTITLGKNGKRANLLVSPSVLGERGIDFYEVERGGDITFHGPGQLVAYPIISLKEHVLGVRRYMEKLEAILIRTLRGFNVDAHTRPGMNGVWVGSDKVASIGVHVRRRVTWHGFALNIRDETRFFELLVPCGLHGVKMTSLEKLLGTEVNPQLLIRTILNAFVDLFQIEVFQLVHMDARSFSPDPWRLSEMISN